MPQSRDWETATRPDVMLAPIMTRRVITGVAVARAIGFATIPARDLGGLSLAAVNRMILGPVRGMSHRILFACLCATLVAAAFVPVVGQAAPQVTALPTQRDPQRDPVPQPAVRRVPVGTAVITGTVTAADTGRPLRGVRVSVNGNTAPLQSVSSRMGGPGTTPTVSVSTVTTAVPTGRGGAPTMIGWGEAQGVLGGMGSLNASRTTLTDAQGAFVIEHLPAGQYSVSASRNTFLTTQYGQKKPAGPGTTVLLNDGQKLTLNLQLFRGGVIAGTVFGEDGDPLVQTQVQVWRFTMNSGVKRLQRSNSTTTDDRGAYRLSGLQPGEYLVSATVNNSDAIMADRMLADTALIEQAIAAGAIQAGAAPGLPATVAIPVPQPSQNRTIENFPPGYVPAFHPNTIEPRNATTVRVAGGDEHRFIDIQVRVAQASNIVGTVTNPPGQDLGVQVFLMNDDPFMDAPNMARVEPNGQFVFRNVSPGKYTVLAEVISAPNRDSWTTTETVIVNGVSTQRPRPIPQLQDSQRMWGRDNVSVDGQAVVPSSVTLRPGKSISGMVIFDMARPPDLTRSWMMVSLQLAPDSAQMRFSQLPQGVIGPDGRFTISGVSPGRYQIRPPGPATSAIIDGKDTLDFPLDFTGDADVTNAVLTVTDKQTEIAGRLTDATGKPGADETVIIASTDDRYWTPGSRRIAYTRTRADGQYVFRNLPSGSYVIAVVNDLEFGMQYDVEFLRSLAAAGSTRVTLAEGEKLLRDLRVAR